MFSPCCNAYIVLDAHTSDGICCECGRVQEHFNLIESEEKVSNYAQNNCSILTELADICKNRNICDVIFHSAKKLYIKNKNRMNGRGKSAYSLYLAFLEQKVPRTYKEIAAICQIPVNEIARNNISSSSIVETKPSCLAERVLWQLGIENKTEIDDIKRKADELFDTILTSHPPQSALALAIILIDTRTYTVRQVATACSISPQCVRRLVKKYHATNQQPVDITLKWKKTV